MRSNSLRAGVVLALACALSWADPQTEPGQPLPHGRGSEPLLNRARQPADVQTLSKANAALEKNRFPEAERLLQPLSSRIPILADYVAWMLASARYAQENWQGALRALEPVWSQTPSSPLAGRAAAMAARCYLKLEQPAQAAGVLRQYDTRLAQPQGLLLVAEALAASSELVGAAMTYQKVYYQYPLDKEAAQAEAALTRLRQQLGDNYPPAMPQTILDRASKLLAKQPRRARIELERIAGLLGGAERDLAQVRIAEADYFAKENETALRQLKSLSVSTPDADAERLFYLVQTARRLEREQETRQALAELARLHPDSPFRLEALISAGNRHFLENGVESYEPYFRACWEDFAGNPKSAYCHWRAIVVAYLKRRPEARQMLEDHLRRYPSSEKANSALYFLGRLSETANDAASAKRLYQEVVSRYPNSYYAMLARARLADARVGQAGESAGTQAFLNSLNFPARDIAVAATANPSAETKLRIERARLLAAAGLDDWMETEMRFAANGGDQAFVAARELAALQSDRGFPDRAVRTIKLMLPEYLFLEPYPANDRLWRLAFPLPYRQSLEKYSSAQSLDPFLVAGLIRQESEFNPRALSRAKAYGLTQVMPSTGRSLSRQLGVKGFRTSLLWNPDLNLKLGTYYFRQVLESFKGNVEAALAAYNAGPSRAVKWLKWGEFQEPAEFVESIPFLETREYVQAVQRNAAVYRQLYSGKPAGVPSTNAPDSTKNAGAPAHNKKRPPSVPKSKNR